MALHHVHAIVVTDTVDGSAWGILSDMSLPADCWTSMVGKRYRRDMADRDFSTISSDEPVMVADELMRERGVGHIVVQHARSGRLTGMLSSLDIAGILAGGQT